MLFHAAVALDHWSKKKQVLLTFPKFRNQKNCRGFFLQYLPPLPVRVQDQMLQHKHNGAS